MEKVLAVLLACMLATALQTASRAEGLQTVSPGECMPRLGDYTQMWWTYGLRARSPEGLRARSYQAGDLALAMDVDQVQVVHLGRLGTLPAYEESGPVDNADLRELPPAALDLSVRVGTREYHCVGSAVKQEGTPTMARLVESGRNMQRADILGLEFADSEGNKLSADGRLEVIAWPDRLSLLLDLTPRYGDLAGGPCFGRVGNGMCFDGDNRLDFPHEDELEPAELTLETWVFLPRGLSDLESRSWLVCKDANEWDEGNYGLFLERDTICAFLNTGGGRENCHLLRARNHPMKLEQWRHVAMSYDGTVLKLYVDGEPVASEQIGSERTGGTRPLTFGHRQDGFGQAFRGVLDEIRLYSRALPDATVRDHAAKPEAVSGDGLVRQWSFDEGAAPVLKRPGDSWKDAQARITLTAEGREYSGCTEPATGNAWDIGQSRAAWVTLGDGSEDPRVSVAAADIVGGQSCPATYDNARGWHWIDIDGIVPQGEHNDAIERVKLTLTNPGSREAPVRLIFAKTGKGLGSVPGLSQVTGISMMLRDTGGNPTGLPVQLSKNWHNRDSLYNGAWLHAASFLRLPAQSVVELELNLAYGHWGGVAAASHAQLCLIGWGNHQLWDEAAMGCWGESICFEPDQGQAGGAVLDTRPLMVSAMGDTPHRKWGWTCNVGGADFLVYYDQSGDKQWNSRMRTVRRRTGPVLTETTYAGQSQDGKIDLQYTVSLYRTDDINRGVYRFRYDVREPVQFSRLVLFQCGGDDYSYTGERKFARGNENGLSEEWETQWGGGVYRTKPARVDGRIPWFSMHEAVRRSTDQCAWANRGVVIRSWDAKLGGSDAGPWAAELGAKVRGSDTSLIDILPPPDVTELVPGDYVEATVEHIIMPQFADDYYGPNEALRAALKQGENTWRMIHREATGNDVQIVVTRGSLECPRPAMIKAQDDVAEFSIGGGVGYVPITITGLSDWREPVLEMNDGDRWVRVDQSVHGKDFWQTDFNTFEGTWDVTYSWKADALAGDPGPRRFRFTLGH